METIKTVAKRAALVVFLADFVHVYTYLTNYYADDPEGEVYDDERVHEDQKLLQSYSLDCADESLVNDADFDRAVEELLQDLEQNKVETGLVPEDHPLNIVNRESIVFAGGGRATFLQLAHPFIAAGIRQHSALERGVSRRFYNTFKYMFGMSFGTREEIAKAARTVRTMHNKVFGKIGEDVGIFSSSSRFDASEKNAIRFVGATLLETGVFEYEMHVRLLTDEEKDSMVRDSAKLLQLFGVRPSASDPKTWAEFRKTMAALFRSRLLTVSDTAKDTAGFLLLPPGPSYKPLLDAIRWSTIVSLPPRLAKQYSGRSANLLDRILYSLFHAYIRFVYRLTPPSWRYLSAYWRMIDRVHPGERSSISKFISGLAGKFTSALLAMAMPDRDPDEARRKVKEMRAKEISMQRIPNSPLKVGA